MTDVDAISVLKNLITSTRYLNNQFNDAYRLATGVYNYFQWLNNDWFNVYIFDLEMANNNFNANIVMGGSYADVGKISVKYFAEAHHMISKDALKIQTAMTINSAPCIIMSITDHMKTKSWGKSDAARDFRKEQARLLANGDYLGAFDLEAQAIRELFGDKYDAQIQAARNYLIEWMQENGIGGQ